MFYHFFLFSTPIKTVGFVPQCLLQKNRLVFRCRDIHCTCTCVMMKQISSSLLAQDEFMAL